MVILKVTVLRVNGEVLAFYRREYPHRQMALHWLHSLAGRLTPRLLLTWELDDGETLEVGTETADVA